jgi:hypothetical protein
MSEALRPRGGLVVVFGVLVTASSARGIPAPPSGPSVLPPLVTPEASAAIQRGLEYLAHSQSRDGSWRSEGRMGRFPVAMTALAGLALLANGNTTTQGPYAPQVSRAAEFLLQSAGSDGLITSTIEESKSMYGHGFTMLFLGELLGMEADPDRQRKIQEVLHKAVQLTGEAQSFQGGWYYTPNSRTDEGSVTITQLQGLRACRNAGVTVPKRIIDRALGYLDKSILPDGGIAYRVGQPGASRPPITAAAVACWYNAGMYDAPYVTRALEYCKERIPISGRNGQHLWGHYFYSHLYMSQIMWLSSEENWQWYFPRMRDQLIALQNDDGSWYGDGVGKTYGTAIALFVLQIPYQYLPIMQR